MQIPTKKANYIDFAKLEPGDVFWHCSYMYIRIAKRDQMYVTTRLRGDCKRAINAFSLSTNTVVEFDDDAQVEIVNARIEEC